MPVQVQLTSVTREDVGRIAEWLQDPEVSDMWFGRYTYGDAAHLCFEPDKMVVATVTEWDEVFKDPHHEPHRDIFSVRTPSGEHIGEAQLSIDEALGDAQISVLIGRKDLWHRGYGTATTLALLEHIFVTLGLYRAWVDVPEYNAAAREMFRSLGFRHEGTLRQSRPHQGARHNSVIMGMLQNKYVRLYSEGVSSHVVPGADASLV
jgi:RimJ/RimL family protein N-acetyltransferase